jgi:hypothetical protein
MIDCTEDTERRAERPRKIRSVQMISSSVRLGDIMAHGPYADRSVRLSQVGAADGAATRHVVSLLLLVALFGWLSFAFHPVASAQNFHQNAETGKGAANGGSGEVGDSNVKLAKELHNPMADLITVPVESRVDAGPGSTRRYTLNILPDMPFELTSDWLLVSRSELPLVYATKPVEGKPSLDNVGESPVGNGPSVGGMGDITQSFFLAPMEPMEGWIWGAGPVLRLPTASREAFGEGRWGAGPTADILRQDGAWSYGVLASHIWSYAGWGPTRVSATYLEPFLAYTTASLTTIGLRTESGYDWVNGYWVVPLDASVSQLVRIGDQPVEVGLGARLYAERPDGGPDWGLSLKFTFMFDK